MTKLIIMLFLFSLNLFAQSRFFPDADTLKPKDPDWGIEGNFVKFNGGIILISQDSTTVNILSDNNIPIKINNIILDTIAIVSGNGGGSLDTLLVGGVLGADKTIDLDNTMDADSIQTLIDNQPKNLGGNTLTFQAADGTYTTDTTIFFNDFYGGNLSVLGNDSESGLHTNQAVTINCTGDGNGILSFNGCRATVTVKNIKLSSDVTTNALHIATQSFINLNGLYLSSTLTTGARSGLLLENGITGQVASTYITGFNRAISASNSSMIQSNTNDDTGTLPAIGLWVSASVIHKISTQPNGSVPENPVNGGVIR